MLVLVKMKNPDTLNIMVKFVCEKIKFARNHFFFHIMKPKLHWRSEFQLIFLILCSSTCTKNISFLWSHVLNIMGFNSCTAYFLKLLLRLICSSIIHKYIDLLVKCFGENFEVLFFGKVEGFFWGQQWTSIAPPGWGSDQNPMVVDWGRGNKWSLAIRRYQ